MRRLNPTKKYISTHASYLIEEWWAGPTVKDTPQTVKIGSDKRIMWKCKNCNHIWTAPAKNRAIHGTGCPKCHERYNVGFPELAIYYYIKQVFSEAQLNIAIPDIEPYESVDIMISELNLIIEYDGGHTHRDRFEKDYDKSKRIIENGYRLIRVRDNGLAPLEIPSVEEYLYKRISNESVGKMVCDVLEMIKNLESSYSNAISKCQSVINIGVDNIPILAQVPPVIEKDNVLEHCPSIEEVWDYEKNNPLQPQHFKKSSNFKAWFTCENEHTSLVQIGSKVKGHGCKVCMGMEATEECNLALLYPSLVTEWDHERNLTLPDKYLSYSNKKVFWKCPECHSSYDKSINERSGNGENCPYCAGKRVNDTNSLATTHPHLLKEWNHEKNDTITPYEVTKGVHKKVWWTCKQGHSYQAVIYSRANGRGCKVCYESDGRKASRKVKRENSLAIKKPKVASQWHPTKNKNLTAYDVGAYARKEYWWLCENQHEWLATPNQRNSANCKECKKN